MRRNCSKASDCVEQMGIVAKKVTSVGADACVSGCIAAGAGVLAAHGECEYCVPPDV